MSKHTPGPWRILEKSRKMRSSIEIAHNHGKTFTIMAYPPEGSQHRVCVIDGPSNRDLYSVCTANARLIAASPELLEACQDALETLVQMLSADPDYAENNERLGMPDPLEDKLERAIAKATK
jgi:hypothetical protein